MPTCNDCGNKVSFNVSFTVEETRVYDPESGELQESKNSQYYDRTIESCAKCQSEDVSIDPIP